MPLDSRLRVAVQISAHPAGTPGHHWDKEKAVLTTTMPRRTPKRLRLPGPQTAHDAYSAWREGQHDDVVLARALACWWGEAGTRPGRVVFVS